MTSLHSQQNQVIIAFLDSTIPGFQWETVTCAKVTKKWKYVNTLHTKQVKENTKLESDM